MTSDWVQHAVFYQIFPDRFARSGRVEHQEGLALKPWGADPAEQEAVVVFNAGRQASSVSFAPDAVGARHFASVWPPEQVSTMEVEASPIEVSLPAQSARVWVSASF